MFVIPAPGVLVIDPFTYTVIPPQGREVGDAMYWHRRINSGELVIGTPTKVTKEKDAA